MPVALSNDTLQARAQKIVQSLEGTWRGTKGMCRCPAHDDRTPSLSVTLGRRAILFHCFAGCPNEAVLAALSGHGIGPSKLFHGPGESYAVPDRSKAGRACARRLWQIAAALAGTPAETYLRQRRLLATSPELRFLARTPLGPRGEVRFLPAMLAAVRDDTGVIAVHRTFVDQRTAVIADVDRPKRALGTLGIGAVRLALPLGGKLGLAEGIETALAATRLFGIPCWATLGNERFGQVAVPDSVRELTLFVDHDAGGELAERRAREAYARADRTMLTQVPERLGDDWNDVLVREVTIAR
jgi:putative DNA primase/helicase